MPRFVAYEDRPEVPHITPCSEPLLIHYPCEASGPRPAVIVCPGGGYQILASHEGEPVARAFHPFGIHGFVLRYQVPPAHPRSPIIQLGAAVAYVRRNAAALGVRPDAISICGFSAGGHLCGSLSVHWKELEGHPAMEGTSARPDSSILCYAVLSGARRSKHSASMENLLGKDAPQSEEDWACLEKHVDATTPPAFLWHTYDDTTVPPSNSLLYAMALDAVDVPYSVHIYPKGKHGLGLAPDHADVSTWANLAGHWLTQIHEA